MSKAMKDTHSDSSTASMQHLEYNTVPPAWRATVSLPPFASLDSTTKDAAASRGLLRPEVHEPTLQQRPSQINKPPVDAASTPTSCVCSDIRPLVFSIAKLIPGLNESANRSANRTEYDEFLNPRSSPLRTMQWIVDQLSNVDTSLRASKQALSIPRFSESGSSFSGPLSRKHSDAFEFPLSPRKRPFRDLEPSPPDEYQAGLFELERRSSQGTKGARLQLQTSADSNDRFLPSPATSSIPSWSAGHQPSHLVASSSPLSMSSTTAPVPPNFAPTSTPQDYVADLQHRITMKSLALQSLQAEHSSLMQDMHRESAKTQASKKKAEAAEQEINELAARNEELTLQIKDVQTELTELETRREDEVQSYTRDREQWSRMLDMSGRLQRKAEESQRQLQDDITRLRERIAWYEQRTEDRFDQAAQDASTTSPSQANASQATVDHGSTDSTSSSSLRNPKSAEQSSAAINMYRSQIDMLRTALDSVRQQNISISDRARELHLERDLLTTAIESALNYGTQRTSSV